MASKIKVDQIQTADGSGTIALQNQLSGMTSASMPTGSVLQVVQASMSNEIATTTGSWNVRMGNGSNNFKLLITPSSTSSKILLTATVEAEVQNKDNDDDLIGFDFYRNATGLTETYNLSGESQGFGLSGRLNRTPVSYSYLDSPSTVNEITYDISFKRSSGTGNVYAGGNFNLTTIIAQEIAG